MYWILTLLALLFALPTYGISLLLHIMLIMTFKDKTTNTEVRYHIKKAFTKGKIIDTNKIEWEDALQYAQQEGKELTIIYDNMISFYICQGEERKYILMMPNSNGGVSISSYKKEPSYVF